MLGALLPLGRLFQKSSDSDCAFTVFDLEATPQLLAIQIPKDRIPEAFFTPLQNRCHDLLTVLPTSFFVYANLWMSADPLFKRIEGVHELIWKPYGDHERFRLAPNAS